MLRVQASDVAFYRFVEMAAYPHLVHAVFTRQGGFSQGPFASLNVGHTVGDDLEVVEANHELICRALGIARGDIVTGHQVHGSRVVVASREDKGRVFPATDALITHEAGVFLMLRFADCVPLFFYDPLHMVVGLAHAGWRGTLERLACKVVGVMRRVYGTCPADLVVGIGPSIGPCCYRIGEEVAELVRRAFPRWPVLAWREGGFRFDLWEANRRQLVELGVQRIEVARMCTCCRHKEFFSHRADGGKTGRFAALMGLRER